MLMLSFARDRLSSGNVAVDWPFCLDVTGDWHVKNRRLLFVFTVFWFSLSYQVTTIKQLLDRNK